MDIRHARVDLHLQDLDTAQLHGIIKPPSIVFHQRTYVTTHAKRQEARYPPFPAQSHS